ncbi:hypothetical protein [Trichloromonas acetexigens]|jgi:hypothetical protein|uniref:Uncharacterized protein n=1 Tax=Trichloromonas acetexigens TaxID=38815 RepID=A0A550JAV5_9BACT|nr:hypothetical protein [Desulfuromonas acetexigens]TRO80355.1 hypothetical protein FL622_12110 [Desulfuromonas acetexigens]
MRRLLLILILILLSTTAWAQLDGENLLQIRPPDYQISLQERQGQQIVTEMIPAKETADNWSEQVATRIFLETDVTPAQYQEFSAQEWRITCPDARLLPGTEGKDNGYPFSLWIQVCPRDTRTGGPEYAWFKAIRGQDNLYVVRKTFRFEPSEEQVKTWVHYLRSIRVCDPRRADAPCPPAGSKENKAAAAPAKP